MKRKSVLPILVASLIFAAMGAGESRAAPSCSATDFSAVVDQTAQALRDLNQKGSKRFQEKLRFFQEKYKLSEDEIQARAIALQDEKMNEFNREIDTLVTQMDTLSQTPNERINCEKLEELKRVRDQLLTSMGLKSGYMLAKADAELDRPAGTPTAKPANKPDADLAAKPLPSIQAEKAGKDDRIASAEPPREQQPPLAAPEPEAGPGKPMLYAEPVPKGDLLKPVPQPSVTPTPPVATPAPPPSTKPSPPAAIKPVSLPSLNPPVPHRRPTQLGVKAVASNDPIVSPQPALPSGQTALTISPTNPAGGEQAPTSLAPTAPGGPLPPLGPDAADTTYSNAEIEEAGRGVFGTINAQFAAAINYAFQQFGRPNAYITGSEGGGAILAGLRYGSGKLHSKVTPETKIYWQGPSLGYDLGAEGSSALFLVYNLEDPNNIYGRFTGIGGSAYVAGGLGLNVLGKGKMVMVPIRTGLGLRIGANLAYLKFTERQTWNPF